MIFCLPLLLADGRFTSLDKITVKQLEKFVPFMVSCSVGREKPPGSVEPLWWPSDLPFAIPLKKPSSVRHKWLSLLKSLVCRCYTYHGCEFMLRFCTDLTNTPNSVLTYVDTWHDTVSVYSKRTGKLVVTFRSENMTYDKPLKNTGQATTSKGAPSDLLRDNTHFLDIYVCEMCDFTFPSIESAQEHEEVCKFGMVHPAETEVEQIESQQEKFLKSLGLKNSTLPDTENKSTAINVTWKLAGVSFARSCAIPLSSPLGVALYRKMRHTSISTEVHLCKVERHCGDNAEVSQRTREARHMDGTWPTTWKRNKTSMHTWAHSYKFPRKHLRSRPPVPDTGLRHESLKLLKFCKPFSVVLHKLRREEIKQWSNRNLDNDLELCSGSSSENIGENSATTVEEESLLKNYLTTLNSQIRSGNLFAYDAVTKQLICKANGPDVNLLSEHTPNIVRVNRTYSCETSQSEKLTVLDSSCVQNRVFSQVSDGLSLISSSPSEGSVCSSPEPFLPQSIAALLEPDAEDGQMNTTDFCLTREMGHHLTQFNTSSMYIPEAYTLELYPVCLHSEEDYSAFATIRPTCEYPKSRLISYFLPQSLTCGPVTEVSHQSVSEFEYSAPYIEKQQHSFPMQVPDISMYTGTPPVYPKILNPLLPLDRTSSAIHAGLIKKSVVNPELKSCNYSSFISDKCETFSKNNSTPVNSEAVTVNTISNQLSGPKIIGEQEPEAPLHSIREEHKVSGANILSVPHTAEKLNVYQNVEQVPTLADVHFTQQSLRKVSLNSEHDNPGCSSKEIVPTSLCAGNDSKSEVVSSNKSCFSTVCEPEVVFGSVTYKNILGTRPDSLIGDNNICQNSTETSETECEERLLFTSVPVATHLSAKESVGTSVKSIENNFPKLYKNPAKKVCQNSHKLSREVQKLMKDECVSIRDRQFFKILNCDDKVLRKREVRRRCTNRVNKIKKDFIIPCRTKSFKAYKYVSSCKLSNGVNDGFCVDVVRSVQKMNSKEHVEVPLTPEERCANYHSKTKGPRPTPLFSEKNTSININHKIENSLSMHYELQSVKRNGVELKLESSDKVRGTRFQHCGKLESFQQYCLTSVNDGPRHNANSSENCNNDVTVRPSVVSSVSNSASTSKPQEAVGAAGRSGNSQNTCQMKLRSRSLSDESEKIACTTEKTRKAGNSDPKQRPQKSKMIKNLNQPTNHKGEFADMYNIMLDDSSRTQAPENEECCGYMQICSSSRLRIFRKRQILGRHKKKAVSKELQLLLQDECKELVNLGLERTNMRIKEASRSSVMEISKVNQLREIEEDHREWFKNKDVMCVINFPMSSDQSDF